MEADEAERAPGSIQTGPIDADAGPGSSAGSTSLSLSRSSWHGAKVGFRGTSYVAGPIAAVSLILGLALVAFGVGAGRGWGAPTMLPGALAFYTLCELWAGILGAVIGLIGALLRRARPGTIRSSLWSAANRPIRLSRRSRPGPVPVTATPRRRRLLWPWLIGVPAVLVLAVAFAAGVYLGRMVDRRLADAIAVADRDDPAWGLDDLMAGREAVPDVENSALVVGEALSFLPEAWPSGPAPPDGMPKPPSPAMEAYDRMAATADNVRLDDETAGTLRSQLDVYEEAVRIARTVADYRRGRHELEIGPSVLNTFLPETQATRSAARLMAVDSAIRADDDDIDGALDSCRAIFGVARSIGDEPFAISQLVRFSLGTLAMKSTRRVLAQGEPSDPALARLQDLVLDEMAQPLIFYVMRGERAGLDELVRRISTGELPISALSDGPQPEPPAHRDTIAPWGRLMYDNQRAVALEWTNETVAIIRHPTAAHPKLWKAWEAEMVRVNRSFHGSFSSTLPLFFTAAVPTADSAHSRYQADLGATAILLAAERQRLKADDWPASIEAIGKDILPSPPIDPFSGKAFRMERRDGQLLIYSIGPDGKDDRGAFEPKRWMKGGPDDVGTGGWDVPLRRRPAGP